MRLAYDPETDSLYIHLSERAAANSDPVAEDIVLDFADDGALVGIDVQHASKNADIERLFLNRMPFIEVVAA